jgi:anaerobic magnesium-protoporphyrin IX monomethyl ester cyclase
MFLSKNPDEVAANSPYFPLGLLYLASYVRQQEHEVAIFDATFAEDETAFLEALDREEPDLVGISTLLPSREMALTMARLAHQWGAVVIVGGPDPTRSPHFYASQPEIDIVVHHEGEQTIAALMTLADSGRLSVESLVEEPGLAFRLDGRIVVNEPRPPIENLDTLPLPARDLIDMDRYLNTWVEINGYSSLTISTARGCPFGCEWCRDAVHGNGFRQRSPENVAAEVKVLKENYQIDRLRVVDDVDGLSREWLEAWEENAQAIDGVIPFEGLNELERQDIPMLDVRDSL